MNNQFLLSKIDKNKCLLKFIFTFFIKSKIGPIMGIVFPLLFMGFYYVIANQSVDANGVPSPEIYIFVNGLPSFISLSVLPICLISVPQLMVELKNSILLRKIKNAGFSKLNFILIIIGFYFIVVLTFLSIMFIIYFSFLNENTNKFMSYINYGNLIYALLMFISTSLIFGVAIGSLLKNVTVSILIGISALFITLIFGGQFIPLQVIGSAPAFSSIAASWPLNYGTSLVNTVIYSQPGLNFLPEIVIIQDPGQDIFNVYQPLYLNYADKYDPSLPLQILYDVWYKILNLIMPFVIIIIASLISIKFFNWFSR